MNAKQRVAEKCKTDLIYRGGILSPDIFYLPSPPFHYKIASLLTDSSIKQGLIVAPRGTSKSTIAIESVRSHYLHINTEYDSVIVIQSKTRKEAIKRLWSIKSMLRYNKVYRDLYGKHSDIDTDENGNRVAVIWQADYIKFRYNGHWITIAAIGTGQPVRGILEEGTRVTFYMCDDLEDENNTATTDQMDSNYDVFLAGVASLDKRMGYVRVIGTPIVQGCSVDRIMNNPTGWSVQWYSARCDENGNSGILWDEMYSVEELEEKKADYESKGKLRNYYADYECTVKGKEEEFFKEEYLQYYDGKLEFLGEDAFIKITHAGESLDKLLELDIPIIRPVNIFIGVDPASSTSGRADFSVIMPIAYDAHRNIYILPYLRQRLASTNLANQMIEYAKALHPTRMHVESVQYQTLLRESVKLSLEEEDLYIPGLEVPFKPVNNKEERLETLHHFFANRKVYFNPSSRDFIRELLMFGSKREHDDTLDAFYYATRKLILPDHTIESSTPRELTPDEIMSWALNARKPKSSGYLAA